MQHLLHAKKRTAQAIKLNTLRAEGMIPGVIYGNDMKSQTIALNAIELRNAILNFGNVLEIEVESSWGV